MPKPIDSPSDITVTVGKACETAWYNEPMVNRIRIGVLRGGPSNEYEISLKTGAAVLAALRDKLSHRYDAVDVYVDKEGMWHVNGIAIDPSQSHHHFDMAWNSLHGSYGEDGKLQAFLEAHGIPFSGSGSLASAVGMNKSLSKKVFRDNGIKTPFWKEVRAEVVGEDVSDAAEKLFNNTVLPVVVKPANSGSSVGVSIVRTKADIEPALREALKHGDSVIIEEYIPGAEATCGVIEGYRGKELYALPPIEIRPKNQFFDYHAKYGGQAEEIIPATFPPDIKEAIETLAKDIHRLLKLKHYSRSDFIIHPKRGIFALETNTLPGMTDGSLFPKALRSVGSSLHEFVDHIIRMELDRLQ